MTAEAFRLGGFISNTKLKAPTSDCGLKALFAPTRKFESAKADKSSLEVQSGVRRARKDVAVLRASLEPSHVLDLRRSLSVGVKLLNQDTVPPVVTLPEKAYMPSDEVVAQYRRGYSKLFSSLIQRLLLSKRMGRDDAANQLRAAVYAGLDFYIANHLAPDSGTIRLTDHQFLEARSIVGRYLGSVHSDVRDVIASNVMTEVFEQLERCTFELLNARVTAWRGALIVQRQPRDEVSVQSRGTQL